MRIVKRKAYLLLLFCGGVMSQACQKGTQLPDLEPEYPYPDIFVSLGGQTLITRSEDGVPVYNGGFGSSMVSVPGEEGAFYLLTDRGPVVSGAQAGEKVFIDKRFSPHIAKFKLTGDSMRLSSRITLTMADGGASGIPAPLPGSETSTITGETPLDTLGQPIAPDPNGIDPEGLTLAPDGSFWLGEEYRPALLHFSAGGQLVQQIDTAESESDGVSIPRVFARRRPGAGISGVSFTPDGQYLAAIMAAPLNNPDVATGAGSLSVRILLIDPVSGSSRQYIYPLSGSGMVVSEIRALSNTTFLVLEHDNKLPGDAADPAMAKHIYVADISEATDISDEKNSDTGLLIDGRSIESLSPEELAPAGINTVSKELLADLLEVFPTYPHDKPEGLALIGNGMIGLINDDDYGIRSESPPDGNYVPKVMPLSDTTDNTAIYFIELPSPVLP